jgi:hypothetical protein
MTDKTKKETKPVVLTQDNVIEQAKAGNIMTTDMVNKMNEELKDEQNKQVIAETKRRYTKIAYVRSMSLVHKRKSSDYDNMSTYNIRQLGRLERFLCGFVVTDIIVDEFARTKDDILELEVLDEKKKTLTIKIPNADGKREAKEFKVGDSVPPVISYIEFDEAVEKLEKKLREKRTEIENKHTEEVKTIKQAAGEYYCSDWSYNLKIVTMDGFQSARGW